MSNRIDDTQVNRYGIIKDKRRRLVQVIPNTQTGFRIMERDMKMVGMIDGQLLWTTLIFVLLTGLGKAPLLIATAVSLIIYVGFEVYKRMFFYKNRQILNISDEDMKHYYTEDAIKSRKSDAFMAAMTAVLMIIILITRNYEVGGYQGMDRILYYVVIGVAALITSFYSYKWIGLSKEYRKYYPKKKKEK